MNVIRQCSRLGLSLLSKIDWLPPLLVRVSIGWAFFDTGKGKLEHLDRTAGFFASLGIPMPHVNAFMAGATECFGGLLLVLGLCTRLISVPLAFVMGVAIATAKMGGVKSLLDFFWLSEWAYLAIFLWLATAGPGRASLDHLISRKLGLDEQGPS